MRSVTSPMFVRERTKHHWCVTPHLHDVLAHLAGQVPDELLEVARDRLADGNLAEVGRLVRFARAAFGCTVPPDSYHAVRGLLLGSGVSEDELAGLVFPRVPRPPYEFSAVAPGWNGTPPTGALDLVAGPERMAAHLIVDDVDRSVVAAAAATGGVRGVWRAWRTPLGHASWPPCTRIVLAEVDDSADPGLTRRRLRENAGRTTIVEVLAAGRRVPEYHVRARASSALLWAAVERAAPLHAPSLAALTDPEPVPRDEHTRLRGFLESGVHVLDHWRTDGAWIWPVDYTEHLELYQEAPHRPLLDHARSCDFQVGAVDGVAEHQALASLRRVADGHPRDLDPAAHTEFRQDV